MEIKTYSYNFGDEGAMCLSCGTDLKTLGEYALFHGEVVCKKCATILVSLEQTS